MKKGDVIEKRKDMEIGAILIRNCPDEAFTEEHMLHIDKHYAFAEIPRMKVELRLPSDGLCIVLAEPSFLTIQAKVNWVFENEMAIEYLDTGGMVILDMNLPENQGWVCIQESTPVYQDSVEHMTDEQLRESIEVLRARRLSVPVQKRAKVTRSTLVGQSTEDKKLLSALGGKSAEQILELKRKLGLID